jgi:hypothetical protein
MDEKKYNMVIDINKFLPTSQNSNILNELLEDGKDNVKTSFNEEDFKKIPIIKGYKSTRFTEEEIMKLRKINDALLEKGG